MIDGWFMRKRVYKLKSFHYSGPEIRKYCLKHLRNGDYLYRIFYYDTAPLDKKAHHPLTKKPIDFSKTLTAKTQEKLFESIKATPNFALRLGKIHWINNEWILSYNKLKDLLNHKIKVEDLTEADIKPRVVQKAVDMKIGLDIALIAIKKLADLLIIITGDADIVPALKFARREGLQVCLDPLWSKIQPELKEHVDFIKTYL